MIKEKFKKLISILIIMLMLVNSSLLLVISIAVEQIQNIIDETKINTIYELNLEKYVNYKIGDNIGLMIQTDLQTGIEYSEGQEYKPLNSTGIILNTPKINEEFPKKVEVLAKSTKATNGDDNGKDFDYAYDDKTGEIKIVAINNIDDNGNIYSENILNARDEYQIIMYYSSNCYDDQNTSRTLEFSGKVQLNIKNDDEETSVQKEIAQNFEVAENISGLISIDAKTSDIYNGYINSNANNETSYRTEYNENMKVQVSYKEIADEVKINTKNLFINSKDEENETQDIVYKNTKINKNEVINELGENGFLQILDKDGNVLDEINKDTEATEDGTVEITYENEQTELNIKLSKPEKIGDINIQNTKQIKETMKDIDISKITEKNTISCINNEKEIEQVVDETKDNGTTKQVEVVKQVEIYNFEDANTTEIKNSKTEIKMIANNTEWTNNVQNDVTFIATMVTTGPEHSLFSNPVIDIKLPAEVEKVVLGDISILYDDNLKIENAQIVNENNSKIIRLKIGGTQKAYINNEVISGANIVVPASIILKKDIASTNQNIEYSYANYRENLETGNENIQVEITSVVNESTVDDVKTEEKSDNIEKIQTEESETDQPAVETKSIDLEKISVDFSAELGNLTLSKGENVHEKEYIKYIAKVKNNTGEDITNLEVIGTVPEGTTFVNIETRDLTEEEGNSAIYDECHITEDATKKEFSEIINLVDGEEKQIYYYVRANELAEKEIQIDISATVKLQSGDNVKECATMNNVVNKGPLNVELTGWETMRGINIWSFTVKVTNNQLIDVNDVDVNLYIGDKFTLSAENTEGEVTQNGNIINFKIDTIKANKTETRTVYLYARTSDEEKDQAEMLASASLNNATYYSNPSIQLIKNVVLKISQSSETEGEKIKYGQTVEYVYTIKNESKISFTCPFVLRDYLDDNMIATSVEYDNYYISGEEGGYTKEHITRDLTKVQEDVDDSSVDAKVDLWMPNNTEIQVKIKATPDVIFKEEETSNYGVITYTYNEKTYTKKTNVIKNIVLPYDYDEDPKPTPDPDNPDKPDPDNPDNPDKPDPDNPDDNKETYSISGVVWKDENQNGSRETAEQLLSGITVKLFNTDTNEIVVIDNNKQIVTTGENGEYAFSNVPKGNYIVLFEYDTSKYKLTTYRNNGTSETTNSDAINKTVNIDGVEKLVGVTDTISISTQNKTNIDMGLVENGTYDLSLNKTITNVKLIYGEQKEDYTYDNTKLAKVEIPAKKVDNAKVIVEYKIEVTNEGNVDAIVESIIDYKPDGFEFDKSLNNDWNIDKDNNLTNETLLGSKLKPGESRSAILYLSKTLSKDNMGTFTNSAEILKSSNLLNLKDVDSTEGNKDKSEDDYSEAQIVISVKTGAVLYVGIIIGVALCIISLIVLVKTKKIKFGKLKSMAISFLLIIVLTSTISNGAETVKCWMSRITWKGYSYKGTYTIASDKATMYTYNYYHHKRNGNNDANTNRRGKWEIYCSDGGDMVELKSGNTVTANAWTYTHSTSDDWTENETYNGSVYISKGEVASITSFETMGSNIYTNGSYYLVGPYKATFNGSLVSSGCYVNGKDASGNESKISGATFANSFYTDITPSSGTQFYVKIPVSSNIVQVTSIRIQNVTVVEKSQASSYLKHEKWKTSHSNSQILQNNIDESGSKVIGSANSNDTKTIWPNISLTGSLKIIKKDKDTAANLSGAKFQITGPNNYNKTFTTDANGTITVNSLVVGTYTVKETGAPSGYNVNLQDTGDKQQTIQIVGGKTTEKTFYNRQYGNLTVTKHDQDTGSTQLNGIPLKDIQFKLYVIKNGQKEYLQNTSPTKYSYDDFNVGESNKASAKTFTTNANAQFTVSNLPVYTGSTQITYYVEEYALPTELQEYYDIKTSADSIKIVNGKTTNLTVNNKQQYIRISGYVWEDVADSSKNTLKNNLYDTGENLCNGITVRLKNKNGTVIATKNTDAKGAYTFTKVKITELSNYYIEFEYNGLKYANVTKLLNKDNGSKAIENEDVRTNFNNSFASITGGNSKESTTTGYSRNTNGTVTNNLTYTNSRYSSELVQNTGYTVESTQNSVKAQNGSTGSSIKANTNDAGYSFIWKSGITEIKNVNLGIAERNQPNMAIATDLNNVDLEVNGYSHTYNYNKRFLSQGIDIFSEMQKWGKTDSEKTEEESKYPRTYTRSIYKNYVYSSAVDGQGKLDDTNKLQVYLIYKISIKNTSSLYMSANEIVNYFDDTLEYDSSYYMDQNSNQISINWTAKADKNGYKQIRTTETKDLKINPGSEIVVYLKMKKNTVLNWATKNEIKEETYNVSEITSYSTYSKKDNTYSYYAGIDQNSAPDNINVGTINTYEDDTDSAPVVTFTFDEPRTISGYVFEDTTSNSLNTGNERKGDGKYNASEDGFVTNVKVELINRRNEIPAYIYPNAVTKSNFNAEQAVYETTQEGRGYYEFVGIIPGEYYLKFTYSDGSVVYKTNGVTKEVTTQDYKATIITSEDMKNAYDGTEYSLVKDPTWYQNNNIKGYSTAIDDYAKRQQINQALSTVKAGVKTGYDNKTGIYADLNTMAARTPNIDVAIENVNNEVTNVDESRTRLFDNISFGIVERPRQSLTLTKQISYVKFMLASKEVLAEGNPKVDKLNYVTYPPNGILKIEADNEIIQGAQLDVGYTINVTNNSEIDYDTRAYYTYGIIGKTDKPVTLTIDTVVDYMDQNFPAAYENTASDGQWYLATNDVIRGFVTDDVYNSVKDRANRLLNNCKINLAIGESKDLTNVFVSKLLSSSDDLSFDNYAEVVSITNSVGRFYGGEKDGKWIDMTPGNLNVSSKDKANSSHELDDNADSSEGRLAVVPSTGDNRVVYFVVGISCLMIIACGAILIKKIVL